jgi:hypothetical protein
MSYHWFYIILKLWDDPQRGIYIICIYDDNQPIAIIPTCIKVRRLHFFSFRTIEVIGNIYTPLRGFIVRKSKEQLAAETLVGLLKNSSEWDMIRFDDLSENDSFFNVIVDTFRNMGIRSYLTHQYDNMVIDLSSIVDSSEYWSGLSENLRQSIRRCINKLNRVGRLNIVLTRKPEQDLDTAMQHYFNIYENSWKIKESDQDFNIKLFRYLAQKGFLRLFTMYHYCDIGSSAAISKPFLTYESFIKDCRTANPVPTDAIPIATFLYLVYGKTAYFLKTAYREDYSKCSPGSVLKWFLIKWFIDEERISIIDFQKGDDAYKFKWAQFKEKRVLCKIANPRSFKAVLMLWAQYKVLPFFALIKNKFRRF